jgi:hypothetical protein
MTKTKGTCEFAATSKGLALNTSRRSDSETLTGDTPGHTGSLAAFILELEQRLEEQDQMDDSRASFLPDGARQTCGHNYFSRNPYDVDDSRTNSSTRYTRQTSVSDNEVRILSPAPTLSPPLPNHFLTELEIPFGQSSSSTGHRYPALHPPSAKSAVVHSNPNALTCES